MNLRKLSSPSKLAAVAPEPGKRALLKGQQTKAAIVEAALGLAAQIGLEGLSIGALAEITGMSKSGVFAHFGSREELQITVIREYHERFEREVFYPALPFCTDNGAMIAFAGAMRLAQNPSLATSSRSFDVRPRWPLDQLDEISA